MRDDLDDLVDAGPAEPPPELGIQNPLWDIWVRVHGPDRASFSQWERERRVSRVRGGLAGSWRDEDFHRDLGRFDILSETMLRGNVVDHMSFAVPSPWNLQAVARRAPILEVGAGTGYWAWCLRQLGVDVVATDLRPPATDPLVVASDGRWERGNAWFDCWWTEVEKLDAAEAARSYPDRTLLIVWPYMDDMADRALEAYRGRTVIFVGEERGACADDRFFGRLEKDWVVDEEVPMPQWWGLHDVMWVCRRGR